MLKKILMGLVLCNLFSGAQGIATDDDHIIVKKKGVVHKFVRYDDATDHFTRNIFANWENDTFEVFDQVKDNRKIAIDIGAWIGTTAIWLSKNFHHVIAIDADIVSLDCLEKNLAASKCNNVTICRQPVTGTHKKVIFGPRGSPLNQSISYVKKESDNNNDYTVGSITFKQLIYDYVYANESINSHEISLIKCDIEGGEEEVIEDILYFAFYNKCQVYLSFHLDWWKTKKIEDYEYLFKYFSTNVPSFDLCHYIKQNPFASILFTPINTEEILVKKNIPAVVIGYNQLTFIANMVKQLEKFTSDIIVIDNKSNYQPLINYYNSEFNHTILKQKRNHGHDVYKNKFIQKLVGDVYVLTDPDLQFNPNLPSDFINNMIGMSDYFRASKVGFALLIDSEDIRTDITYAGHSIQAWESQFWKEKLIYPLNPKLELYHAPIDTTFCLINKRFPDFHIRIAGNYTCKHIPWHIDFEKRLKPGEYDSYLRDNVSTNWFKPNK